MPKQFNRHFSYANVMATVAVFVALGGGAYAAAGSFVSGSGTITGCVPKKGGPLKVVKVGKKCGHGLSAIAFNQKGPAGTNGTNGAAGATGAAGTTGPRGPEGISGQTRWGSVLVSEGGTTVLAKVGPFTLSAQCKVGGESRYLFTSSVDGAWLYGEDGPYPGEMKAGEEFFPATDEDYDEALYAWAPDGTTIDAVLFHFDTGHMTVNSCEFQGHLTQTS